ncbi:hypothetical protein V2J09_005916 [Rumex salicifolius]
MRSKSRNFRRSGGDSGADDDDSSAAPPSEPSSVAAKPKKTQKLLMSFADDAEALPVPSSRSSASKHSRVAKSSGGGHHKITSTKERTALSSSSLPAASSLPSNVQPQAGQYTKEALLELQRNTKTIRPPQSERKPPTHEPVIILKGLLKPPVEKEKGDDDELDEDEEAERASTEKEKDDTEKKLGLMEIGHGIPDQAMINAIKAKKERARRLRAAAPDFIALDTGSNHGEAEGLSDEEPEFRSRIAMFGDRKEASRKGVFEDNDDPVLPVLPVRDGLDRSGKVMSEVVADDEEDEEERKWEEEQFRKGLGKRIDDGGAAATAGGVGVVPPVQRQIYGGVVTPPPPPLPHSSIPVSIGGVMASEVMPIAQQADVAKRALQDNLRRLKESHTKTVMNLTQMDENLSASLDKITTLEGSVSAAGEKFIFMQKLRDFVSVICDFLQHKAPYVEELEDRMQQLHQKRATAVLERRSADNHDEMIEAEAALSAAISVFNKGGSSSETNRAASVAAQAAIDALKEQKLPVELDEMGRDLNLQKRKDISRRALARERRRKARSDSKRVASGSNGTSYQRIDGESSTDESDSENAAYKSHLELLLETADQVFSDASEDYSQLSAVQETFNNWKKRYIRSYNDAYMALSAPTIFSPYVRLDFLKWDPLHKYEDFSDMKWHSVLFDYGRPEDGSEPDDADANLVPGLVEKVAVPILDFEITHCWDILSSKETKNAVLATVMVAEYVPSSEALKKLVASIRDRLDDAVADLVVPTWSTLVLKAVPNAARLAAYRFGVAVRLLRNICLWKDILALPVLEKLILDQLLAGKILPHVRALTADIHDSIIRTERVVDALSGVWVGQNVTGSRSNKLQPLVNHILTLAKTLEKRKAFGVSEEETLGLAHRLKKMLKDLNEYDEARALLKTFNIREAV